MESLKSFLKSEISALRAEVSGFEYALWWIIRAIQSFVLVKMIVIIVNVAMVVNIKMFVMT